LSAAQVVFCTHDKPDSLGGPFTWLRNLLPALRDRGVESRVLALTHYGGTGPVVESLRADGFDVAVTDCHTRTIDDVRWILTQLEPAPPRVFIPNFVVPAYFAARWLRQAGAATVAVLHSDDPWYRALQSEFVFGEPAWRVSDVVSVSQHLHAEVTGGSLLPDQKALYIPYGVHVQAPVVRPPESPFRIAYLGRLAETQKRISLVVETLLTVCREVPNTEAVIYGDGPERQAVLDALQQAGPGLPVYWMGSIDSANVPAVLQNVHAVLLMSDFEGLPISLLEGMAAGCVAIVRSMQSGIPQLIQSWQTGVIVDETPASVVAAVRRLVATPIVANALANAGRTLVIDNYSHGASCVQWAEFLTDRLAKRRVSRLQIPRRFCLPTRNPILEASGSRLPPETPLKRHMRSLRIRLGALRRRFGRRSEKTQN
jgi:glycosyltransferase involved in cell wall biosynthesis